MRASAVSALSALCAIARFHHISADPANLAHQLAWSATYVPSRNDLLLAASRLGLKAKHSQTNVSRLSLTPLPALACLNDGTCVILAQCDGQRVLTQTPGDPPVIESLQHFSARWANASGSGELILLASRASLTGALAKFDFSWFIPSLVTYRSLLGEVLLISLFLQLFALVSPLFFQVVMDKVLVNRGMTTLDVLIFGLVVVVLFESALSGLRNTIFSHTTSRIDVELGARLFRHLVALPLAYFQSRRVGDSVARVRELESIRSFLTGNAITVLLDVLFSGVFIAVMLFYSVPLTLIVLTSLPLYFCLSFAVVPVLRARLDTKFARGAENQALLVETITGIQTVKANALEPSFGKQWDQQLAAYVSASFATQNMAAWAHEGINLIGKLVNAATLWYGAHLVMDQASGDNAGLTVGQFVAFNMFAGRVAQPIIRMAQLWTDFQQTGISVSRLGDILNTSTEVPPTHAAQLPQVKGQVTLDAVTFRYRPGAAPVLHEVSLDILPGEVIGIVGRSGSGKSTLTKLVQRLYVPEQGRLLVDGIDISLIDAAQLRRQVGVVLQENLLFNRSVRENIAITDPAAPIEAVMHVAHMAGAHDFIAELPEGYGTVVGEQGSRLSGGQRQRIAIARALFTQPRILIFDEATSALDYESEAIIQRNMAQICQGRTVFIIAHRLSSVRNAHRAELAGSKHLADEVAFLPAALSLQVTPVHPAPRRLAWALIALFVVAVAWACIGQVDIVAVAPGRLVVSERTKLIQPLERAVVKTVHVKDGDQVHVGQILVTLDATNASADKANLAEQLQAARSESQRSKVLLHKLSKSEQYSESNYAEATGFNADIQSQLQSEWADIRARLGKLQAERQRRQAEIDTVQQTLHKLNTTIPLARQREADIQGLAAQAREELTKATQREALSALKAPVAGTVQQLATHTVGGVVAEAQVLMVIVPHEAQISAEATLENKDIGFVNPGQSAEIKLETFPYTRYGTLSATVSRVTADAVADEKRGAIFPVTLALSQTSIDIDGKSVTLSPGMNLTVEIRTGKRRIIDYLLSPIQRAGQTSLRER